MKAAQGLGILAPLRGPSWGEGKLRSTKSAGFRIATLIFRSKLKTWLEWLLQHPAALRESTLEYAATLVTNRLVNRFSRRLLKLETLPVVTTFGARVLAGRGVARYSGAACCSHLLPEKLTRKERSIERLALGRRI